MLCSFQFSPLDGMIIHFLFKNIFLTKSPIFFCWYLELRPLSGFHPHYKIKCLITFYFHYYILYWVTICGILSQNKFCYYSLIMFLASYLGSFQNYKIIEINFWTLHMDIYPICKIHIMLKCQRNLSLRNGTM